MSDKVNSMELTPVQKRKRKLGIALIVVGLGAWVVMMVMIVYNREVSNTLPTRTFLIGTFACWLTFFIGKSILKFQNNRLEPKGPRLDD